jgi:hypothetical protein
MRMAMEVIVMAKFDHDSGSRSRTMSAVYPRDFPLDTEGSRQGLEKSGFVLQPPFLGQQVIGA